MNRFVLDFEKPIWDLQSKIDELEALSRSGQIGIDGEIKHLRIKVDKLREEIYSHLTPWQCVQLARHPHRPYTLDYIKFIVKDFIELHGDRCFRDDPSIICGLGSWDGQSVAIIGQQKGRGTRENLFRNFGMAHPEGYRKALRVMRIADKFGLPIITFIDTPGAYPGLGAEERGQAQAIAANLYSMAQFGVPIIAVVIGEGGSGGALALGVADRVYMLQYAIYSVISPEGCASILYRDSTKAQVAAEALKITATDLLSFKLIDGIIDEPLGGAHNNPEAAAEQVKHKVTSALHELLPLDPEERIQQRIAKFRRMGQWIEE